MKRVLCVFICAVFVLSLTGCSGAGDLRTGKYLAEGNYEKFMTPNLTLDTEVQTFVIFGGVLSSFAETGSYTVIGNKLVAKGHSEEYTFEIKNGNTLVLTRGAENPKLAAGTRFQFSEDMQ